MRFLKISAALALITVLAATSAFAGGSACSASNAQAKQMGCCASGAMANVSIEATRLSSGGLVVHYAGKTPEAVAYLQAKCEGQADKFCCPMTAKMSKNTNCKVDLAKVNDGVLVFVTSQKQDVVDQYEKEFAALTLAPAAATK